ncbi:MAG: S-layer homology domain-containing protein [Oscillospiraceae bacterium]|nr:S-layer homology domain-containing protein [Oscillospiraceae bacterium]
MKRKLCVLLTTLLLAALLPVSALAAGRTPVLALTSVPACGERGAITGLAFTQDGSAFDPSAYRVTLYVELTQWNSFWPKPSLERPYVALSSEGGFAVSYDGSIASDREATSLHVLLLPAAFTPGMDYAAAEQAAVDHVHITRTADGGVTVSPRREAPTSDQVDSPAVLPPAADRLALNVGFYTTGAPGGGLDLALIRDQLEAVADYADTVRLYGASGELYPAYEIAHTLGLKVIGTAWLSGNDAADKKELDALVEHCNKGYACVACVGSETLYRGDLTPEALIADMDYVRTRLEDPSIPVTTADVLGRLLDNVAVRDACDLLMANSYPYWEGVPVSGAVDALAGAMRTLQAASPGKEVVVSETGWPTEGAGVGAAKAGTAEAAQFFAAVRAWSLSSGTQVLWFDAADEPWKAADEGVEGAHWGMMDSGLALKRDFAETAFFRAAAARCGTDNFTKTLTYTDGLFRDVAEGAWYRDNVSAVYEIGLMNGKGGGVFDPLGNISMAEVITIACRMHDVYHARSVAYPAGAKWYDGYVRYALATGMLSDAQSADVERLATRAEVAELLAAALPDEAYAAKTGARSIPDVTGEERYAAAVRRLYAAGVVGGVDAAGTFAPARSITRAEVAAIATRASIPALRLQG